MVVEVWVSGFENLKWCQVGWFLYDWVVLVGIVMNFLFVYYFLCFVYLMWFCCLLEVDQLVLLCFVQVGFDVYFIDQCNFDDLDILVIFVNKIGFDGVDMWVCF